MMTVAELIEELQKHDPTARVQIFSDEAGYIDIIDIFDSVVKSPLTQEVKPYVYIV